MTAHASLRQALFGALAVLASLSASAAPRPPLEDVGDPDSFGRDVVHLGFAQSAAALLLEDCTDDPSNPRPPEDRCIVLNAQPAPTAFNESGLGTLRLPARASRSLLCFALTPFVSFQFNNLTGVAQLDARFNARAVITIENEVLDDPTLLDPGTGAPFGGRLTLPLSTYSESRSIGPGEREQKNLFLSRHCIAGLVSRQSLINLGLSEMQATAFFNKPMKLTLGASGFGQIVDFATFFYGLRVYGDR